MSRPPIERSLIVHNQMISKQLYPRVISVAFSKGKYRIMHRAVSLYPAYYQWDKRVTNVSEVSFENIDQRYVFPMRDSNIFTRNNSTVESTNIGYIRNADLNDVIVSCYYLREQRGVGNREAKLKGRLTALMGLLEYHKRLKNEEKYLFVF